MTVADEDTSDPAEVRTEPDPGRVVFAAVAPCGAIFVVTILAMIAAAFGDPASPVSRFFDEHGMTIIVVEAAITIGVTLLAMTVDRWSTVRRTRGGGDTESGENV